MGTRRRECAEPPAPAAMAASSFLDLHRWMNFIDLQYAAVLPSSLRHRALLTSFSWLLVVTTLLATLILLLRTLYTRRPVVGSLPPGPRPWPVVGNLFLLVGRTQTYRTLAGLSRTYGPVFTLRLGSARAVVACSAAMAGEFLRAHDAIFSDKPSPAMARHLLYGPDKLMNFSPYGPTWQALRRLWSAQLLGPAQLQRSQHVRHAEVAAMLRSIQTEYGTSDRQGRPFRLPLLTCLSTVSGNIFGRLVLSQRLFDSITEANRLYQIVEETIILMLTPLVEDFLPAFSWLDARRRRAMAATRARLDDIFDGIIEQRREELARGVEHEDVLDILLRNYADAPGGRELDVESAQTIKSILLEMFVAGMDTSTQTINWAMGELMNHPSVMEKVHKEADRVVGKGRMVMESDLPNLPYLKAVVKEVFRLHPVAPLLSPHRAREACHVAGYHIPAGTRLLVNAWAVGRDPSVWKEPHVFRPERFEGSGSGVDVRGQHSQLIPFGCGRRMCPGIVLGSTLVELTLANLLHNFLWSLPLNTCSVDLSESQNTGSSHIMASPLILVPTPRFHLEL